MNEVYLYADMIVRTSIYLSLSQIASVPTTQTHPNNVTQVHIDSALPRPPSNEIAQTLTIENPKDYMFGKFIDVIQVWQAPSDSVIKVNDIVLNVAGKSVSDPSEIPKEGPIEIEYLHRPYVVI